MSHLLKTDNDKSYNLLGYNTYLLPKNISIYQSNWFGLNANCNVPYTAGSNQWGKLTVFYCTHSNKLYIKK